MSWNYRLLAYKDHDDMYFEIHDVYYNKEGIANGYGAPAACVGGNSIEEIKSVMERMKEALEKPILWAEEGRFPEEYKP